MFAISDGYELYMGRWSRLLAPRYAAFAGVKDGERILDVGTGTGAAASTLAASLPRSEIVGIDPSAAFIAQVDPENIHAAKDLLGHHDFRITEKHYLPAAQTRRAGRELARVLRSGLNAT